MASKYPHLERLGIPYKIENTDALVKSLMRIAETKPFLDEYLGTPQEIKLLRKAKVRAVTYSNQIEGNHLEEKDVTAVLKGKKVAGPEKDIKEVQNYFEALDYVEQLLNSFRVLKISDMCDLQKLVTNGLLDKKYCGQIRSIPVSIKNSETGEILENSPEPHELKDLLNELWNWLDDTKSSNAYTRAFAFHYIAVSIHPFVDGNGRTVRLMQHLLLLKEGEDLAKFVPSETSIMQNRSRYYTAIRQSRSLQSLHPIVEFLAECYANSAEEVVKEGKRLLRNSAGKTPEARHKKILSHAKKVEQFSMQDVVKWLPEIPRRTLERDMANLVKSKLIRARGKLKARIYELK